MYVVTGTLVNGRRFAPIHTSNYMHAMAINLWRGSVWNVEWDAREGRFRRTLLKRVFN